MTERRVQVVEVQDENIGALFRGDLTIVEGLPDDATLVQTWEEPHRQTFCFMFESEEFPVVEQGVEAPVHDVSVVQRRVNAASHHVCHNCFEVLENGDVRNE